MLKFMHHTSMNRSDTESAERYNVTYKTQTIIHTFIAFNLSGLYIDWITKNMTKGCNENTINRQRRICTGKATQ